MSVIPYSHKGELVDFLRKQIDLEKNKYKAVPAAVSVIDKITKSQVFKLPHKESLPTVKDYNIFYEFMKHPYPMYLIEMPVDGGHLIFTVSSMGDHTLTDSINKKVKEFNDNIRWWDFITKKETLSVYDASFHCGLFHKKENGGWVSWGAFDVEMDVTGYEVTTKLEWAGHEENRRFAWAVFEFMVAVNTPNIKQKEIKPPKLINAKRKKKGKSLLEGYKYLDLIPREQLEHGSTGAGASKRMHWRRGHIRRLVDRTTWVRPALIGQHGFIDKTYRLPEAKV